MSTPFSQFCDQVVRLVRRFPARGAIAAELAAQALDGRGQVLCTVTRSVIYENEMI